MSKKRENEKKGMEAIERCHITLSMVLIYIIKYIFKIFRAIFLHSVKFNLILVFEFTIYF